MNGFSVFLVSSLFHGLVQAQVIGSCHVNHLHLLLPTLAGRHDLIALLLFVGRRLSWPAFGLRFRRLTEAIFSEHDLMAAILLVLLYEVNQLVLFDIARPFLLFRVILTDVVILFLIESLIQLVNEHLSSVLASL